MDANGLVHAISENILNPILLLLFVVALLLFVWGIVELIWGAQSDESRSKGKQHLLWGTIGVFIMASALAIVELIQNTVNGLR